MNKCEDRKKLQRLLKQRKDVEAQIRALTFNRSGKSYRQLLQLAIESALAKKYPGVPSYKFYNEYNRIKTQLHKELGVSSKMLTHDEYLASIGLLADLGYDVAETDKSKDRIMTLDSILCKGDFNIPGRVYNLLVRHTCRYDLTPRYILGLTERDMISINGAGVKTWADLQRVQEQMKVYFE